MNTIPNTQFSTIFTDRLVTLSTGCPGLRATLHVDVKTLPDTAAPILDFIASDATVDRAGETISPSGWLLESYRRNPVFQNSHQYGDVLFTIGKALVTEVRDIAGRQALYQRVEFAVAVNPIAKITHGLYVGGFLHAVSIGMVPRAWEDGGPGAPYSRRFTEQELVEVSAVAVPANPNALLLGLKSGALANSDLRDLAELLRSVTGPTPAAVLALARDVHQIIKSL